MEKRKIVLLSVAGVCLLAAGVFVYTQMTDQGPPPPKVQTLEEQTAGNPALQKDLEKQLEIQKTGPAPGKGTSAGS